MKLGLVAGGAVAKDCANTLRLSERLGPVAALSFRVASRIANSIRAGRPVKAYADLDGCDAIIVAVPDSALGQAVASLRHCGVNWSGVAALLYSARCDSSELKDLQKEGASVASLRAVGATERRFLVEGDAAAVRWARLLVQHAHGRAIQVDSGAAATYLAAVSLSSSLFTPLIEAAIAALRLAGAPPLEASRVAEMLFERSLRAHKHGGRKSWTGPLALGDQEEVFKEVEALSARDPLLGRYYEVNCALALQFFGRHPKLLKALRERSSGQV
jgi:predicted short-subunit dehydrogenase-like oxidoreductase (DUF2520 family)